MRGLDISCDTEDGERLCAPNQGGAAGFGGRLAASPHPSSAWRRCLFLLPRLRAPRGGRGRRQLEAGAWPGAAGRGLLGRLLATGRGIAGRSRPRRPGGSGAEGSRRSSPAEPWDPALLCEGQRPASGWEGAAGPGGGCRPRRDRSYRAAPGRAGPPSAVSIAGRGRGALCPGRPSPPFRCSPAAGAAYRSLPRGRAAAGKGRSPSCGAAALGGSQRSLAALWRVVSACQGVADPIINRGSRFACPPCK